MLENRGASASIRKTSRMLKEPMSRHTTAVSLKVRTASTNFSACDCKLEAAAADSSTSAEFCCVIRSICWIAEPTCSMPRFCSRVARLIRARRGRCVGPTIAPCGPRRRSGAATLHRGHRPHHAGRGLALEVHVLPRAAAGSLRRAPHPHRMAAFRPRRPGLERAHHAPFLLAGGCRAINIH